MRLSPLRQVEKIFLQRLSADPRTPTTMLDEGTPWYYGRASEVSVRGGVAWKALMKPDRGGRATNDLQDAQITLDSCAEDIVTLWTHPDVQHQLREMGIHLENQSGFFLDQVKQVAAVNYEPSFSDILKARLRTIGVEEHPLVMEPGGQPSAAEVGQTWLFYDVGGARSEHAAWAPYFDDVNAMIFLCSLAGFNEVLVEDKSVNRLLDSFTLWKTICASKLLTGVTFILLMNKMDLLSRKLEMGQQFAKYVRSYKYANEVGAVVDYLKTKFTAIHKSHTPRKRQLHVHLTTAIDIRVMSQVLVRIREAVLVGNLMATDLL